MPVETKVDSDGSLEQLRAAAVLPHYGVLFAVGLTSFELGQAELGPRLAAVAGGRARVWQPLLDEVIAQE
jgi:hypothetical protein